MTESPMGSKGLVNAVSVSTIIYITSRELPPAVSI